MIFDNLRYTLTAIVYVIDLFYIFYVDVSLLYSYDSGSYLI